MPWSYTAPEFHAEEERKEKEALSAEELNGIHNGFHGIQQDLGGTEVTIRTGLLKMEDAIEMIDIGQKKAYLEAKERAPKLVEMESDPVRFLKCEAFDALAAARRLTEYWKQRLLIFGSNKYVQPMTIEGAMSEDWENLLKAYVVLLPKDERGRNVIFFDRTKFTSNQRSIILRILFYMFHISCESETAPHLGLVFTANLKNFDFMKHFDRMLLKKMSRIVVDAMPTRWVANHIFCGTSLSFVRVCMPVVKQLIGRRTRLSTKFYFGQDCEMLAEVELYGLRRLHLSHVVGGSFSKDDYLLWLRKRRERETKALQ